MSGNPYWNETEDPNEGVYSTPITTLTSTEDCIKCKKILSTYPDNFMVTITENFISNYFLSYPITQPESELKIIIRKMAIILLDLAKEYPDLYYKNLIYLNKASAIGHYSMYYRDQITFTINNNNIQTLYSLLYNCKSIEYDDNDLLSDCNLQYINYLIEKETTGLCLFIQETVFGGNEVFDGRKLIGTYSDRACNTKADTICLSLQTDVLVTEKVGCIYECHCYGLKDILFRIVKGYSGLSECTINNIVQKYSLEIKLIERYLRV